MKKIRQKLIALGLVATMFCGTITVYAGESSGITQNEVQQAENEQESVLEETKESPVVKTEDEEEKSSAVNEQENSPAETEDTSAVPLESNKGKNIVLDNASTEITNVEKGIFHVTTGALENSENIKYVQFAVWSEENGQDDLVWYMADRQKSGEFTKDIDISNHKYSLGTYQIHIYVTDTDGNRYGVRAITQKLEIERGTFSAEKDGDSDYRYNTVLENLVVPGGVKEVLFPTWSTVNGQDDLVWYSADKDAQGTYKNTISVMDHKGFGEYNVHAYVLTKGDQMICVDHTTFNVEGPEIGKIEVRNVDDKKGTYQIVFSDIKNVDLMKQIQVPTWSEKNGQDDLVWYNATKNKNGEYVSDIDIRNHKYSMGKYISHVYVYDIAGGVQGKVAAEHEIAINKGEWNITPGQSDKKQFRIELTGLNVPGGVKSVVFPIWSEVNGQDDLVWYTATNEGNGNYCLNMSVSNHKGLGKYIVNAYAVMPDGTMIGVGESTFAIDAPEIGGVQVNGEKKDAGEFQVKITGVKHGELIKNITVPIWSEDNQGNLVWYTATKNQDGDYVVNVNISNHKYNVGIYKIGVYLNDITGTMRGITSTTCDMRPSYDQLVAEANDDTEKTYDITVSGLKIPAGEKSVLFAVWGSAGGQNDLHWYTAQKVSEGTYRYTVRIRDHAELGTYNVNAYCTTKAGKTIGIGSTGFEVTKKPMISGISVTDINGTSGTFKVTVSGVIAPSGVESVQVPVWCSSNQNDIVWYTAMKDSAGNYTVNVNVKNHQCHFGTYTVDAYVTMGNGIRTGVGRASAEILAKNYVYSVSRGSSKQEVYVLGVEGASDVQFPTWSDANGQDDIVWYSGTNHGNGTWSAVIDSMNHASGGAYTTHVYVTDASGKHAVGVATYSLTRVPTEQALMLSRANLYNSSTQYLILVNRSTHKVGVFSGWQGNWRYVNYWDCSDGAPSTPTVEGRFTVGIRGYYFDSGASRCYWYTQFKGNYLFHSVLYNKNGTLRDGRLGMALSHGCVRLDINNAKWIYDNIPAGTTVVVYH